MTDPACAGAELESRLLSARAELERRLSADTLAHAEDLRDTFPDVWGDPEAALELAFAEYVLRAERGEQPSRDDWFHRFPQWCDRLERLFAIYDLSQSVGDVVVAAAGAPPAAGYELLGEIGRGGMGVVYKARQVALGRVVALKMLRGGALFRPEDAERIRREAAAVARLQHPNIVQVFETGELDGVPFLSLEYVAGGTLEDALSPARRKGADPVSAADAAALVETLARAVDHAHRHGIVHRDLKPANILLSSERGIRNAELKPEDNAAWPALHSEFQTPHAAFLPKVTDFGLAAVVDAGGATRTGAIVGTPSYMAPEQAAGAGTAVGPPADVYALGGILYRMLVGRPPFEGGTALETLDLVRHADPVPPSQLRPNLPRDLETVCLKCLRKEPAKRYASAAELADDLGRFLRGEPVRARPVSALERGVKWARRRPVIAALAAAVVVLVATSFGLLWAKYEAAEAARATEEGQRRDLERQQRDLERQQAQLEKQQQTLEKTLAGERVARARAHWNGDELDHARRVLDSVAIELRDTEWQALYRETHAEVASRPLPPPDTIRVAPSPDGKQLAYFGRTAEVYLANAGSLAPVAKLDVLTRPRQVAFDDEGNRLVVFPENLGGPALLEFRKRYNRDPSLRVSTWDLTRQQLATDFRFGLNTASVMSGDGRRVATRIAGTVTVLDTATGLPITELAVRANPSNYADLTIDHRGNRIAQSELATVYIWSVENGRLIDSIRPYGAWGRFSRSGSIFLWSNSATDPSDRTKPIIHISARDIASQRTLFQITIPNAIIHPFAISPNENVFAFVERSLIRVHDLRTGRHLVTLRGHTVLVNDLVFSPDNTRLYSVGNNLVLKVWDVSPWTAGPLTS